MSDSAKRLWKVAGYQGGTMLFERIIPGDDLSQGQAGDLLTRLAARDLTVDQVISASLGTDAAGRTKDLELMIMADGHFGLSTKGTTRFTVVTVEVKAPEGTTDDAS